MTAGSVTVGLRVAPYAQSCFYTGGSKEKNIEHRTSNIQFQMEKMNIQTYDLEERLLEERMNIERPTSNFE
jgi:hypothetical protein